MMVDGCDAHVRIDSLAPDHASRSVLVGAPISLLILSEC